MRTLPRSPLCSPGCLAAALALSLSSAFAQNPPAAPSRPVVDTFHGVVVVDPYRNLENLKDPETHAWLDAQAELAATQLARIPERDALETRIRTLTEATGDTVIAVTRMSGDRVYYLKRRTGENQFKLVARKGLRGAERVLVDPEALTRTTGVPHAINWFVPSWDGRTVAYGISAGGSEDASMILLDVASGRAIGHAVPHVSEGLVHWTPDSRSLTYNQLRELPTGASDTETYLDSTVYLLKLGDAQARPLFGPLVNQALRLARLDVGEVLFSPDSAWMLARTTDTTTPEGRLFVAPLVDLRRAHVRWTPISVFEDRIIDVRLEGDTAYLRSVKGAPRGRVLALSLKRPVLAQAREVVPEPKRGVLEGFDVTPRGVLVELREGFETRVRLHTAGGPAEGRDLLPGLAGSARLTRDPAYLSDEPWLRTSAWTEPDRIVIAHRDGQPEDTRLIEQRLPPDAVTLEVDEVLVPSHDGTQVPLAVVRRKGLARSGDNPTLLIGYGAYGISYKAAYNPRNLAWFERGGVIAYANVRGSGAYGEDWHRAGFKTTKPNTWKDGIACARWLVEQRWASPKTLGILGGSAGGIFVGRAVTTAPELFAAAIFDVGLLDMVRAEETANGITNVSEFGTTKDPAEFRALLEMSTYHHLVDGTAYPGVLLVHGLNDPRVDPWQSAKTAARLQAATASGRPILLRLDGQAGHGVGSTAQQAASKLADEDAFLLWQFGKSARPVEGER